MQGLLFGCGVGWGVLGRRFHAGYVGPFDFSWGPTEHITGTGGSLHLLPLSVVPLGCC